MSASDGNDIQLHERIFAQVLGVEENEEFATELTYYAADLLQILPPGWIVEVGEGELAGIPLFVYTDTDETEWNHPYESEYRRRIQSRRNELYDQLEINNLNNLNAASILSGIEDDAGTNNMDFNASAFNASSIATDFTETGPAVFDVVPPVAETPNEDEASESPVASDQLQDYEILFAQVLGVKLDEKQFLPLAYLAKELLKIVPDGWELLLSTSATGVRVPYYYEQATRSSHWVHPYENQYKDLIDKKRQDLLANAVDSPTPAAQSPIPTPMSTARSFVSESSINSTDRMALIEAMFAGAVGISPFEEFASELGDFAKELLMTLPAGWEVVIADSGKTTEVFPLFVNTLDNSSQLEHPMLNEHTQSIEEMRTTLLYGVLPSEFSQYDEEEPARAGAGVGAGAEPSAEFLAQEAARQAEEEDIARSIATVKSFEARIAEAERVAAERTAADQKAKEDAEAIAKIAEEAPMVVKTEAELKAELKAQRKAERIRQNEEDQAAVKEAVRHAQIAREQAEQALKEAQAERIAEEEAEAQAEARRVQEKQAEELRLKEIADQIEAEARAVAEEAEIAEKQARLQEKLAAEIRAEEEEEALAEAARKEVEAQHEAELAAERAIQEKIEAELAAQRAIEEEKQRVILCEQEAAEVAIQIIQEAEIEVAEEYAAAELARIAEEARLAEEARREEERIAEEKRLEAERIALAILAAERLEVLKSEAAAVVEMAIAMAMEKIECLMHESSAPIVVSTAETVITEGWVMSPPAPSTPMDASVAFWGESEEQGEKDGISSESQEPAEQAAAPELTEEELEMQRVAGLDAAAELATIESEASRIVDETVATLVPELALESIEAIRQEIIDKERAIVEAREAEEREAKERAERRIAQRKATEAAALEALRKAEEEERALEEAAKELFRKELELARQASFLSTARTEGEEGDTSDGPAVTTTAEVAGEVEVIETGEMVQVEETDEPDELALTIPPGGIDFSLQPESPDSARLSHLSLQDTFALGIEPAIPKEITSADLMLAAQNNAIRLKTQYLDHAKSTDKATRLTSKRNSVADTDKTLTPKTSSAAMVGFAAKSNIDLRNVSSDMEELAHDTAGENSEDDEDSPHRKKDWKSKILRPLSKVSPKKEAQRRRRAASRHSPTRSLSPGRRERLWEMTGDEDEAAVEVGRMKWYRLGCYKTYEEAVKARKVVQKMVVSDSQGTIIVDPRIDISDADLVATLNQTMSFDTFQGAPTGSRGIASAGAGATGLSFTGKLSTGPGSRASTASPTFHRSAGTGANAVASLNANNRSLSGFSNNNLSSRPGTTAVSLHDNVNTRLGTSHGSRLNSASPGLHGTQRSTLSSAPAGVSSGPLLPAANDTRELILGRVMRTTEKTSMLRVRKDLGRMQWVLETDDFEVNKITDRHRKKKGVDIEGKVENVVSSKAKRALKAMEAARAENDDFATQTLKKLPAMDELLEANLLDVLATSKSFGTFTLTSQLIASERQLKEEIKTKVGKITGKMATPAASATNKASSHGKGEPKSKDFSVSPSKKRGRSASPAVAAAKLTRADSAALLMNNASSKMNTNSSSAKKQEPASKLVLPEINRKTDV